MPVEFGCLVVKNYKGTTKSKQTEIVKSLGARRDTELVWKITASTIDEVKKIEAALLNKVPYRKVVVK